MRRDIFVRGGPVEFNALLLLVLILFLRLLFVEIRTIHEEPRRQPFSQREDPHRSEHHSKQSLEKQPVGRFSGEDYHQVEATHEASNGTVDDEDYSSLEVYDDDEGALARIERALVAPIQLIGSIPQLQPGHTLRTVEGKDQRNFPQGSIVLITEIDQEFYRGYIVNIPLPERERIAAREALRIANGDPSIRPTLENVIFFGNGGPVRNFQERWSIIHNNPRIRNAIVFGESLAVGGEVHDILNSKSTHMILLYGTAVWLPGQLEREIKDGFWTLSASPVTKFEDLLGHCFTPVT